MKGGVKAVIVIILICGLVATFWFEFQNSKRLKILEKKLTQQEAFIKNISKRLANLEAVATPATQAEQVGQKTSQTTISKAQSGQINNNWQTFSGEINEKGLCGAFLELAEKGDVLCAHAARILYWKLDLRRSLTKGDKIKILYKWQEGEKDPQILALEFLGVNQKVNAYIFKPSDYKFASYFDEEGVEIPARLQDSPIQDYEQITAFFSEHRGIGPAHKGIDFKAPVNTPVYSPFNGVVTRHNWNWKANGNSLEIKVDGENLYAIFLHLNGEMVKLGDRVKKGQLIAKSGNTGKTTAPNLHYQLEREIGNSRKPIDPLKYHNLYHRKLEGAELERLKAEISNLKSKM